VNVRDPSGASTSPYHFDELGSVQFARVCAEILSLLCGVPAERWTHPLGRLPSATLFDDLADPSGRVLPGPVLAVSAWATADHPALAALRNNVLRSETLDGQIPRSLLVLTNRPEIVRASPGTLPGKPPVVASLGPEDLGRLIDHHAELRFRMPSLLGVRDLDGIVPGEALARSTGDIAAARNLARVFMPTRAYTATLDVLRQRHFAVLTGPPEMGKTAIARTLALAALTTGKEVHECVRPDELWSAFDRHRPQVFIADDAFGSTEYRPDAAERWALELDRVLRAMDDRHWLIWTSRPAPLRAGLARIRREHGVERFPHPAQVQIDASQLDIEEKALILFRHAMAAGLDEQAAFLVRREGFDIVAHEHFTPERIRRFVADRLPVVAASFPGQRALAKLVHAEIAEPTGAMALSLRALGPEHRALLVALLDAPPGPVPERELAASMRRHSDLGLARSAHDLVDRMTDHFLHVVPPASVTWVHPSWRDLVIDDLRANAEARRLFIERSGLHGVLLAISVEGGRSGERLFPLLVGDRDWDALGDRIWRLVPELGDEDLTGLLGALEAAARVTTDKRTRAEVEALVRSGLAAVKRELEHSGGTVAVSLLCAWLTASSAVPPRPEPPDIARTWIDLVPTGPVDVTAPRELQRFDDWLCLAEALSDNAPEILTRLGFPDEQWDVLVAFSRDCRSLFIEGEPSPLAARALARLARAAPDLGTLTAIADYLGREADPPPPLSRHPAVEAHEGDLALVGRILSDLRPLK
jgi:hypothetical protein